VDSAASARAERFDPGAERSEIIMDTSASPAVARDVPLDKLKASPQNVRRTDAEAGIGELAASIAAHGLLQPLVVAPERDEQGQETGRYLVTAGERRRKALRLLAKQKRIGRSAPIPCMVRDGGDEAELSLAENVVRLPMHPADQFVAFARLKDERGLGPEEIAARFGTTPAVVRQRLKLAAVSPALLKRYRAAELTLDQLMAFALTDDHRRQEEAFERLGSWGRAPEAIRRLLTEGHVGVRDRRALFVGLDAYEAAGGTVLRDLFAEEGDGWLADAAVLERLVAEKLEAAAEAVRAEGWRWVEACAEYPHRLANRCRRVYPRPAGLSAEDQARLEELRSRLANPRSGDDEDHALEAIAAEVERLSAGGLARAYAPEDVALAGAIVALGQDGELRVERGLVRPEDEPAATEEAPEGAPADGPEPARTSRGRRASAVAGGNGADAPSPLSRELLAELGAERTLALQECVAGRPEVALLALTHALALRAFGERGYDPGTCLLLEAKHPDLSAAPAAGDGKAGRTMAERHAEWAARLPSPVDSDSLWAWLTAANAHTRLSLLAYCVARTIDAVERQWEGRRRDLAHADRLAEAAGLDMAAWWEPTKAGYLGRVPKALILEAVAEGASRKDADSIAGLKKDAMAEHAERLLKGTGWLPAVWRRAPAAEGAQASA
jgi:ParB family transcriptional regulator, chromosome partitioning protein